MFRRVELGAMCLLALLAGCGGSGSAPTGQVVATVDGQEITAAELNLELANAPKPSDPAAQKRLQGAALQSIVNRKILAKAASEQGLDKAPTFAVEKARADDMLLISALERKTAATAPKVSKEEAERFVAEHPDSFAQRKQYVVDQLVTGPLPANLQGAIRPLKTLPQIEALLAGRKLQFQRAVATVDGAQADPELIKRVAALAPGEVFVVPAGGGVVFNQIRETRVVPLPDGAAIPTAQRLVAQRRTQEIVRNQLQQLIAAGSKTVKYNANYAPEPAAKAPAAPAR